MRTGRIGSAFSLLLFLAGCDSDPVAPVLSDSRVYRNPSEGFRLLVPEGWNQTASSVLPPGSLESEIFLTRYSLTTSEMGATFQVLCMDDRESLDLAVHHAGGSFGVDRWEIGQPERTESASKDSGERFVYAGTLNGQLFTKFVTSFRRTGRVYSFVGVCRATDENAKQQIERATDDIIWEK